MYPSHFTTKTQTQKLQTPFNCMNVYLTSVIKSDLLFEYTATSSDSITHSNWFVDIHWECPRSPSFIEGLEISLKRSRIGNRSYSFNSLSVFGHLAIYCIWICSKIFWPKWPIFPLREANNLRNDIVLIRLKTI